MPPESTQTPVVQGTLHMLIRKTLTLEPMHGYGIGVRLEQISKGVFQINAGSLFPALRRLERDGLIERSPDPNHGRRSRVKLTARGRAISQVMGAAARDLEKVASRGITAAEMNEFFRVAELMIENLAPERQVRKS